MSRSRELKLGYRSPSPSGIRLTLVRFGVVPAAVTVAAVVSPAIAQSHVKVFEVVQAIVIDSIERPSEN